MAGVINISDGLQDEIIMISTPSSSKGEGYVLVHGAVVIINPSLDFGYGRMVTVNFEPGVFRDLAGNLFPGLSGEYYFYTAPSQFALAAPYVRYPSFRSPRFTPREGAMLHFVNDTLILYGGISNGVCLADTWVSRTGAEWTQVTGVISDHNRLVPLVSHSPTSVDGNGCIWLLGGRCNSDAGTLWKTCDIGRSWSHVPRPTPIPFGQEVPPKFPDAFRDHAMTVLGGWQLIVVDASPGTSEAVWRFNSPAADHVQRVSGGSADAVSRKGPLPFGLRRGPKLMATSQGGLFLVGGNLCPANGGNCSFNDVWYSPDVGVTWHCKTKNYGAKTLPATWQGIGEGFAAALTQDDTIFLMAGEVPGDQESALAEALESFTGLEDIYLSQPYMVLPGSVSLGASPARPDANFTILFSEELKLADDAWARFHELPGNYSDLNDTNSSAGESVEAEMMVQGKDLVLRPRPMGLLPGRRYLIEMEGVQDKAGNNFGRIRSYDLQVQILEDWEAPEFLSMYPPHGAGGVEPWTLVTLTFNEDVFKGHGALQVEPMKAYGVHLELPISHGTVVLNQVVFKLPPERRLTADMEYRVLVPEGLVQDFIGNKVAATVAGSFRTMSGWLAQL
ncbi:unnamed protein product [Effrenium voratum]|nr:unnamed protein product [Effrenium voratum]